MIDEEKYAIDYLKTYINSDIMYENRHYKQIETVLNLIEKQSKEIEELKETLKCTQNSWYEDTKIIDKIKAKIEDILNSENSEAIEKLTEWQALLEKE